MNFLQALGVSKTRVKFHVQTSDLPYFQQGDIVTTLDKSLFLVEGSMGNALFLRELNWWGRLLHKFGWLV